MALTTQSLWQMHPGRSAFPCSRTFKNQCAIRMSVALKRCGEPVESYGKVTCWHGHGKLHILRAQELAIALNSRLDEPSIHSTNGQSSISGKGGIVFLQNFFGPGNTGDHIDVWNGVNMKGGFNAYFDNAQAVWFWELP